LYVTQITVTNSPSAAHHQASIFRSLAPSKVQVVIDLSKLRNKDLRPSVKVVSTAELSFLEIQRQLWAELAQTEKDSYVRFCELSVLQLKAGMRSGRSDCFLVALLTFSQFFLETGDPVQASHYIVLAEHAMSTEPSLLVEGWAAFCRGDLLCSTGEFIEAESFLESSEESWFEGGLYSLWQRAIVKLAHSYSVLGSLAKATDFLAACELKATSVGATGALLKIFELQVFNAAERGKIKRADESIAKIKGVLASNTEVRVVDWYVRANGDARGGILARSPSFAHSIPPLPSPPPPSSPPSTPPQVPGSSHVLGPRRGPLRGGGAGRGDREADAPSAREVQGLELLRPALLGSGVLLQARHEEQGERPRPQGGTQADRQTALHLQKARGARDNTQRCEVRLCYLQRLPGCRARQQR
jgi:hypothetical protein